MPEGTEEVLEPNTEGVETEEEDGEDEETNEDGDELSELDKEVLIKKVKELEAKANKVPELEAKNKSLYDKLKSGYKKHSEQKQNSLSKDEFKSMMQEYRQEEQAKQDFVSKYEDAKDLLPEVEKLMWEKSLDIETAYDIIKWKMFRDEWYRNQILWSRTENHGSFEKKAEWFKYKNYFSPPKIAQPRNAN